jgi:hypothetical protein
VDWRRVTVVSNERRVRQFKNSAHSNVFWSVKKPGKFLLVDHASLLGMLEDLVTITLEFQGWFGSLYVPQITHSSALTCRPKGRCLCGSGFTETAQRELYNFSKGTEIVFVMLLPRGNLLTTQVEAAVSTEA